MNNLTITATIDEILTAKFHKTFLKIEGYLQEADGDIDVDQTYSPQAVRDRIKSIKDTLKNDLAVLIQTSKIE